MTITLSIYKALILTLFILLPSFCLATQSSNLNISAVMTLESNNNKELTLKDILSSEYIPITEEDSRVNRKPTHDILWLKVNVFNHTSTRYTEVLDTHSYLAHRVEVYIDTGDGLKRLYIRNNNHTLIEGDLDYPYLAFPVTLTAASSASIYLKLESYFPIFLEFSFKSSQETQEFRIHHSLMTGLIISFFLVMAIINLSISFAMKKRYFLWFTVHEVSVLLFCLSQQDVLTLLPSDSSQLNSMILTITLLIATIILFFVNLYNQTIRIPAFYRGMRGIAAVLFLVAFSCLFYEYTHIEVMGVIVFIGALSILAMVTKCTNFRDLSSALILISVLALMTTSLLMFGMELELVPKFLTHHEDIVPIGHGLVSLLMFFSLASHVHKLRTKEEYKSKRLLTAFEQAEKDNNTLIISERNNIHLQRQLEENLTEFAQSSHDFHNNLFSIKLLLKDIVNDKNKIEVNLIDTSIVHLEEITTQMMYNITGNPLFSSNHKKMKSLNSIFDGLNELLARDAEYKSIIMRFVFTSKKYGGIEILMKRLLENIVRNAIRYTPIGGKVLVGVRNTSHGFKIQIIDNGIGMSKDKIFSLLQPNNKIEKSELGFGIGFSNIRDLCEELNCTLNIESDIDNGSKISLEFGSSVMKSSDAKMQRSPP